MTWNRDAVQAEVLKLFDQHKQVPCEVTPESQIVADLGIDSLGVMEVLADLEDAFKLTIPDEALREINTIGDVGSAILAHLENDGRLGA